MHCLIGLYNILIEYCILFAKINWVIMIFCFAAQYYASEQNIFNMFSAGYWCSKILKKSSEATISDNSEDYETFYCEGIVCLASEFLNHFLEMEKGPIFINFQEHIEWLHVPHFLQSH